MKKDKLAQQAAIQDMKEEDFANGLTTAHLKANPKKFKFVPEQAVVSIKGQ